MPDETRNATREGRAATPAPPGDPARRARIAIAAYYRAERRGFAPGREIEDWLEAEREVDRAATAAAASSPVAAARDASEPAGSTDPAAKVKARKSRGNPGGTTRR